MKTRILHTAFFTPLSGGRWGLPILAWGPPGAAKTAAIKQLGRQFGLHVEHLAPGERGEGAFGVTPVPDVMKSGKTVLRYPPPEWVENLLQNGEEQGIVFLDELNTAPPALQPALLGAIQERRIGGHEFGPRVRVLGAANPVNQAAGGWDLAPPVANRLGHIDWPAPDAEEWAQWLLSGGVDDDKMDAVAEEKRVMELWPEEFAKASGLISAFVRRRPDLLHRMPSEGSDAARAWPSPRTWEYATRALAGCRIHNLTAVDADELVASFVGNGAAGELAAWIAEQDLPSPTDVLDRKVKFQHVPERLDRTEAVLSACAALIAPNSAQKRQERTEVLWELAAEVMKDAKDIVVPAATTMVKAGLDRHVKSRAVLSGMHSVVIAAGIRRT